MTRALLVVAGVALLAGCPNTSQHADAGRAPECQTRADCPTAGEVCTDQKFCAHCSTSGQCTVKETCDATSTLCVLRDGWGTQCAVNEDCQAGSWCMQGLCKDRSQVSLCPSGLNTDCPQGFRCNRVTTVCEEDLGCSIDADCSASEVCNTGSRACVPMCTAATQADVCAAAERCVDSKCVQCTVDADCGVGLTCDPAGQCNAGSRCYTDRDCPVPLVCLTQTGACLPRAPPCITDDTCAVDQRCDVPSGKCIPRTCQPDRYEPDDDRAHAFNVAPGPYRTLTLCPGDVDWYAISLARGDQLGVNLDADPFSENTFSTVIKDGTGRTLAGGHLLVSYVAPVAASYYVVIATSDQYQPYGVTFLKSRGTPCDDDAHEPNDTASQPTVLNQVSSIDGVICPQDQDWFRATIPAGKGVTASLVNYDQSKGPLSVCVFTPDGVTVLGCASDPQPSLTVPASAITTPTVAVRVIAVDARLTNSYTLQVEFP